MCETRLGLADPLTEKRPRPACRWFPSGRNFGRGNALLPVPCRGLFVLNQSPL